MPFSKSLLFLSCFFLINSSFAGRWGKHRQWTDGRAEVVVYESERVVYGKPRKFREQLITVPEDLRRDTLVKADRPKDHKTIRVFKLNIVQKFETDNYPYSYMASVFVNAKKPSEIVKMTVGSQEWCGNTFKSFKRDASTTTAELNWSSYFDGEADQTVRLDWQDGDMFFDQLPVSLRDLPFKKGYEKEIRLWDSLTSNRGKTPRLSKAFLYVDGEETVHTRAGSLPSWKVVIKSKNGTDTFWFTKDFPHMMTKMEAQDGQKRLLYAKARWSYWDRRIPKPNILK